MDAIRFWAWVMRVPKSHKAGASGLEGAWKGRGCWFVLSDRVVAAQLIA